MEVTKLKLAIAGIAGCCEFRIHANGIYMLANSAKTLAKMAQQLQHALAQAVKLKVNKQKQTIFLNCAVKPLSYPSARR